MKCFLFIVCQHFQFKTVYKRMWIYSFLKIRKFGNNENKFSTTTTEKQWLLAHTYYVVHCRLYLAIFLFLQYTFTVYQAVHVGGCLPLLWVCDSLLNSSRLKWSRSSHLSSVLRSQGQVLSLALLSVHIHILFLSNKIVMYWNCLSKS